MAIKISGTTVIDDSRNICNAATVNATCFVGDGSNLTNLASGGGELVCGTTSYTLTSSNCRALAICFTGSPTNGDVNLPNATTVSNGSPIFSIKNVNPNTVFSLKDACGCTLTSIPAYGTVDIGLYDNSTAKGKWIISNAKDIPSFNLFDQFAGLDLGAFDQVEVHGMDTKADGFVSYMIATSCACTCCYRVARVKECADGTLYKTGEVAGKFPTNSFYGAPADGYGYIFATEICNSCSCNPGCIPCRGIVPFIAINCDATCGVLFLDCCGIDGGPQPFIDGGNIEASGCRIYQRPFALNNLGLFFGAWRKCSSACYSLYETAFHINTRTTTAPTCTNLLDCTTAIDIGSSYCTTCVMIPCQNVVGMICGDRNRCEVPAFWMIQTGFSTFSSGIASATYVMYHWNNYASRTLCRYIIPNAQNLCCACSLCRIPLTNFYGYIYRMGWYNDMPIVSLCNYNSGGRERPFVPNKNCCNLQGQFIFGNNGAATSSAECGYSFVGKYHLVGWHPVCGICGGVELSRICCLAPCNMCIVSKGCFLSGKFAGDTNWICCGSASSWWTGSSMLCRIFWSCPTTGMNYENKIDTGTLGRAQCCEVWLQRHKCFFNNTASRLCAGAMQLSSDGWKNACDSIIIECDEKTCLVFYSMMNCANPSVCCNGYTLRLTRHIAPVSGDFTYDCYICVNSPGCATSYPYDPNDCWSTWCYDKSTGYVCMFKSQGHFFRFQLTNSGVPVASSIVEECIVCPARSVGANVTNQAGILFNNGTTTDGSLFALFTFTGGTSSPVQTYVEYWNVSQWPPCICQTRAFPGTEGVIPKGAYDTNSCTFLVGWDACVCNTIINPVSYAYRVVMNPSTGLPTQEDFGEIGYKGFGCAIFPKNVGVITRSSTGCSSQFTVNKYLSVTRD